MQSPIEAEIFIWWPCAHLDRSAWQSIRFGSVGSLRVILEGARIEVESFLGMSYISN